MRELLEILQGQSFFDGLTEAQLKLVAAFAALRSFEAGRYLFREHEPADAFYLIRSGRVSLESLLPGRQPGTFMTLGGGDMLGWSWLIPPYRWHYDARALEPVHTAHFDAAALRERMDHDPVLGYALHKRFTMLIVERLQAARLQHLDIYASGEGDVGLGG